MSESAGKALDLLFYLAHAGGPISLARLSRDTGMNKATALRYLNVLESRGVAERSASGWSLGLALFELGSHVPVRSIVVERVRPFLERLARETGESANLACLAGTSAITASSSTMRIVLRSPPTGSRAFEDMPASSLRRGGSAPGPPSGPHRLPQPLPGRSGPRPPLARGTPRSGPWRRDRACGPSAPTR